MSVLHRLGLYAGILVTGFGILVLFRAGLRRKREKIEDTQQEAAFKTLIDGDRGVNAK